LMAGIDHASGEIIATIEADLQNDPQDIPSVLAKLDEGAAWCPDGTKTGGTQREIAPETRSPT